MFGRTISFLKTACYYIFWGWVVLLHLFFLFVSGLFDQLFNLIWAILG